MNEIIGDLLWSDVVYSESRKGGVRDMPDVGVAEQRRIAVSSSISAILALMAILAIPRVTDYSIRSAYGRAYF
jgi:hypothetical protein